MAQPRTPTAVGIDWGTHEEDTAWEAAHENSARKAANDNDPAWEAVNESTSVNGMNKGMSRGEAEVANTKATEVAEPAVTTEVAEPAVTTAHHRCLIGARKIDTRKPGRAGLDCSERLNRERQWRPSELMLEHCNLRVLRQ